MSEQRLQKYRPGDEIDMVVYIEHAPMCLREVSARFFSQGPEGGIISHIDLSGTPSINEDQPSPQLQGALQSEVRLSGKVAPDGAPGVYRLNRLTVKTYGGRAGLLVVCATYGWSYCDRKMRPWRPTA